jgi:hypothetical protein
MKRKVIGLALALVLARTAGAATPGVHFRKAWGPSLAPERIEFQEVAPQADGSLLAATGDEVFAIAPDGRIKPLGKGSRAFLDPAGRAFGLWEKDGFNVMDEDGASLGALPAPPFSMFKFVPGKNLVYAPKVLLRREAQWVEAVRIVQPDGRVATEFPAPGLEISRLLPDRIVYTLPDQLVARGLGGEALWSARMRVHKFETSGERAILVPRYTSGQVVHLDRGKPLSETSVDGVVWDLAIAREGRFSAATTRTHLYLFQDGQRVVTVRLPVSYANSLDLSDRGEALVGGQDPDGQALLFLYAPDGTLLWRGEGGRDRNGYRPAVRFAPGGDRFLVLERQGLTAYDILRSQP